MKEETILTSGHIGGVLDATLSTAEIFGRWYEKFSLSWVELFSFPSPTSDKINVILTLHAALFQQPTISTRAFDLLIFKSVYLNKKWHAAARLFMFPHN